MAEREEDQPFSATFQRCLQLFYETAVLNSVKKEGLSVKKRLIRDVRLLNLVIIGLYLVNTPLGASGLFSGPV